MKLLIAGSRSIVEFDLEGLIPEETDLIISGGASGIDSLAERFADKKRISKLILRPNYRLYGRGAPLKRNERMIEICDMALVVWDGRSRGTKYTIDRLKKLGKRVTLINTSEQPAD